MEKKIVIALILSIELSGSLGFYIARTEEDNTTDVYQVKEDEKTHTLTFINPKLEKQTKREIIFYHVIETPYNQDDKINEEIVDNAEKSVNNDVNINNDDNDIFIRKDDHNSVDNNEMVANDDDMQTDGNDIIIRNDDDGNYYNINDIVVNNGNNIDVLNEGQLTTDDNDDIPDIQIKSLDDDKRTFTNGHGNQFFNKDFEQESGASPINEINNKSDSFIDSAPVNDSNENIEDDLNEKISIDSNRTDAVIDTEPNNASSIESKININLDEQIETVTALPDIQTNIKDLNTTPGDLQREVNEGSLERNKRRKRDIDYSNTVNNGFLQNIGLDKLEDQIEELENNVDDIAEREERSVRQAGKTYGMRLTGDNGVVWNELNDNKVSHPVGGTSQNMKIAQKESRDDEKINKMINEFESWKNKNAINMKKSSKHDINQEEAYKDNEYEEQSETEDNIHEDNDLKELNHEKNDEGTKQDSFTEETSTENLKHPAKTYGMSLTGDNGKVWNELNGQRVSYSVNSNNNNDIKEYPKKASSLAEPYQEDDEVVEINGDEEEHAYEEDYQENTTEEPSVVNASNELKHPKTYGMSLAGDQGIVWNDLNGQRVSYHVGAPNDKIEEHTTNNLSAETTTVTPDSDELFDYTSKPSENSDEDSEPTLSNETGNESNETDYNTNNNQQNVNNITKEILDIIKKVFENETAKLESIRKGCNNSTNRNDTNETELAADKKENENQLVAPTAEKYDESKDSDVSNDNYIGEKDTASHVVNDLQTLMKNEEFWKWLDDWTKLYLELLMNRIDNHIKKEVDKQIKDYFLNHTHSEPNTENNNENEDSLANNQTTSACNTNTINDNTNGNKDSGNENVDQEVNRKEDELLTKKRKDQDRDDKNNKKEEPVKIEATTVYGNSVGNEKVTNIFIFNVGKKKDLDNIQLLNNGTNGIYVFGNDDKKPDQGSGDDADDNKNTGDIQKPEESTNISSNNQLSDSENKETAMAAETIKLDVVESPDNQNPGNSRESTESSTDPIEHEEAIESENDSKDNDMTKPNSEVSNVETSTDSNKGVQESVAATYDSTENNNANQIENAEENLGSNEDIDSNAEIDKDKEVPSESTNSSPKKESFEEKTNSSEDEASNSEIDKKKGTYTPATNTSEDANEEKLASSEIDKNEQEEDTKKNTENESKVAEDGIDSEEKASIENGKEKEESDVSGGDENEET